MNEAMNRQLTEFAQSVRVKTEAVNTAKHQDILSLQTALSEYISDRTQALMRQGLSVTDIQNALRAAIEDTEPQVSQPDAADTPEETDEMLEPPVSQMVYYLPMPETMITDFSAGALDKNGLMERICASPDIAALAMADEISLVLAGFDKDKTLEKATEGGEIVAGPDGEAFMPEHLHVTSFDNMQYASRLKIKADQQN